MKKIIFPLFLALTLISCDKEDSEDVNQDKIYTDYEMFYNENTDMTTVVARFRFGGATGTLLELSSGANVKFNGDVLAYNGWYGGHMKEYAGEIAPGTFVYTDVNGSIYTNTAPSNNPIAFDPAFDTIVKSQANTCAWLGSSLQANEAVALFVGSWTWGQDALFYQDLDGATDFVMGVSQLSGLAEGTSTMYMDRYTALNISQGTSEGGRIRNKYRAINQQVLVLP